MSKTVSFLVREGNRMVEKSTRPSQPIPFIELRKHSAQASQEDVTGNSFQAVTLQPANAQAFAQF